MAGETRRAKARKVVAKNGAPLKLGQPVLQVVCAGSRVIPAPVRSPATLVGISVYRTESAGENRPLARPAPSNWLIIGLVTLDLEPRDLDWGEKQSLGTSGLEDVSIYSVIRLRLNKLGSD